ncbi:MAG: LysM peptidoglycan-binding domain-containing protein [Acidimicrobiia bacterium]
MRRARALGFVIVVAAAALALQRAGAGALAAPPVAEPALWGEWLAAREPVEAALALVRLAALVALWYLAVAVLVGALLRVVRADALVALTDRVTVPAVRRLLVATASVSLASGVGPATVLPGRGPVAAAVAVTDAATTTSTAPAASTDDGRTDPTLTMRLLPAPAPATVPAPAPADARAPSQAAASSWTVKAGECFWSIADDVLTRAWGRAPSDAEIVPYWRALIAANRSELADRSNEDLIFPGQVFTVPTPPAAR